MPQKEILRKPVEGARWERWRPTGFQPVSGSLRWLALAFLVLEAGVGLWLRFATSSQLWLDEAQSVNIANAPLDQIQGLLKQDGAPPLYYYLLHFWMQLFGSSDVAVRSLSGLISVGTIVVTYFVVKRIWGFEVGVLAAALLGASSFATYYATEARMYSLVMLLTALGVGALARLFESPSWRRLVSVALVAGALAYTQYWSFYLFLTLGLWLVGALFLSKDRKTKRAAQFGLGALVLAGVAFLPWLPTFLFQRSHTGTPWGDPPNFLTALVAVFHFNSNQALQIAKSDLRQRGIEVLFILLFALALFGTALSRWEFRINLKMEVKGRFLAWIVFGTLVLGVVVSHYSDTAYTPRYGAVVYVPLMIFLAVGIQTFSSSGLRVALSAVIVCGLLVGGYQESHTQRTQAVEIVNSLVTNAQPGDVAVFCPDELGPSVLRVLPDGTVTSVGYPRFTSPNIVNWVNYDDTLAATAPADFVAKTDALAGTNHVWVIWSPGYGASGPACTQLVQAFNARAGWTAQTWVVALPQTYFQSMTLIEYSHSAP